MLASSRGRKGWDHDRGDHARLCAGDTGVEEADTALALQGDEDPGWMSNNTHRVGKHGAEAQRGKVNGPRSRSSSS